MDHSIFNQQQSHVQTVGTSYYYSSLLYLGYSPYTHMEADVKPNIWWVSVPFHGLFLFFFPAELCRQPPGTLCHRPDVFGTGIGDRQDGIRLGIVSFHEYWDRYALHLVTFIRGFDNKGLSLLLVNTKAFVLPLFSFRNLRTPEFTFLP